MYTIDASIVGTAPLLQHAFGLPQLDSLSETKRVGKQDYSTEWMNTMYVMPDGRLGQPASHIEGTLAAASVEFKFTGKKTFKSAVKGFVIVEPQLIPHVYNGEFVMAPSEELMVAPTPIMDVYVCRVVVNRAAVARSRLRVFPGWQLDFQIQVVDEMLQPDDLKRILEHAGRTKGIGDDRPKHGRFQVARFERTA